MKKEIRVEFHVHTKYSHDSILTKYFILLMCKLRKINVLVITDHNEIIGAQNLLSFFKKRGITIIVGEEIMTNNGEIIGLFLNEKIMPHQDVEITIEEIRKKKGIVYLPHPYDEKRYKTVLQEQSQIKHKNEIDFIEIHNGRNLLPEYDTKQLAIQKKLKINPIIGSDAHTFFELGRNYIIMDEIPTAQTIVKLVDKGIFCTKKCIPFAHRVTRFVRIIKMVGSGKWNELFRIIHRKCRGRK